MIFIADIDKCEPPPPRKIMVLINPHSGPGKAQEIFQSGVARMLEEADISYTMVVTGETYNISYTMVVTAEAYNIQLWTLKSVYMMWYWLTMGNIDRGVAEVNIFIVSQYHIIYTDLKVHSCFIL